MRWRCGKHDFDLDTRTLVMGILNVTPDSFSDGGRFDSPDRALEQARQMIADGADILDIGGESTRPGAEPVDVDEECGRVVPVIEAIRRESDIAISIDTMKAAVARAAAGAGASIINDVTAATGDPAMLEAMAQNHAGVVLMHIQGEPRTMQNHPQYSDVTGDVRAWLAARRDAAVAAGIAPECIALDPGIGFGKTLEHNLALFKGLPRLCELGHPVLVGPSRKSFIGAILDLPPGQRLEGTAVAVTAAVWGGASIVRVHDVAPMARTVRMARAMR